MKANRAQLGWRPVDLEGVRHRMQERWERMTPEEREKFRAGFRGHCGRWSEPADPEVKAG